MMWIKLPEKIKSLIKSSAFLNWKKCAWVFLLVVIVGFGIIFPTNYANAGATDWLVNNLLDYIIAPIIGLISYIGIIIAGFFVHLSVGILDAAMRPEIYNEILGKAFEIDPITKEPTGFINIAWTVVRDLVNMFFILILLLIAFGTILRIEAYKAKNLLPKLIIAIFLVNFSKIISLVAIDFSQVFMYHLYNQIGSFDGSQKDLIGVVSKFAHDYNPKNISSVFSIAEAVGAFGACVFSFLLGFTYLALAAFMIIRLTMLCLVVVLSPAAFILLTLPSTKQYFSKWMANLIKYSIIGPVFVFFIWLSGLMAFHLFHQAAIPPVNIPDVGGEPLSGLSVAFQNIVPFGVVIFILLYSMQAAKQLGIWGANAVDKMTVAAGIAGGYAIGRWSKGIVKGGAMKTGRRGGAIIGSKAPKGIKDGLKRVPVLRGGIMGYEAKRHKEKRGEIEKYSQVGSKDSFKLNSDIIKARMTDPEEVAGRLESIAKTGELSKFKDTLSEKEQDRILTKAKYAGVDSDYLTNRDPRTVNAEKMKEEVHRIHEEKKLSGIEAGALKDDALVETIRNELDPEEFRKFYRGLGGDQQKAMLGGLKAGFGDNYDETTTETRKFYADLTQDSAKGIDIQEAFSNKKGEVSDEAKEKIEKYIGGMIPKKAGKIRDEDMEYLAMYGKTKNIANVRGDDFGGNSRDIVKDFVKKHPDKVNPEFKKVIDTSEYWGGKPKPKKKKGESSGASGATWNSTAE